MSNPQQWSRVEAALDEILALPESEWAGACQRLAGDDAALHAEVSSLLAFTGGTDSLLDHAIHSEETQITDSDGLPPGTRIGAYRIVSLIGRGGMGEVYRAERADGQYQQEIALKLIRNDLADQPERFQAERQILAQLEHPGIARLLDGGVSDGGRPYMAIELVSGVPVTEWCQRQKCTIEARLRLFAAICDAVAHAHRSLVVHRDIKPGNVLVTDDGNVKLLDFGVAKLLSAGSQVTLNVPLTPAYSAPEQLTGGTITTATDVYALGVLLFELLTGELPWASNGMSFGAAVRRMLSDVPPVPSRRAAKSAHSPVPAAALRGDLDAIVGKALRKEPAHRYATVNALRDDVERFLRHEPVDAREGARLYVLGRFIRRQRVLVFSSVIVLLAILAGLIGVAWQARLAIEQAHRAEFETRKANAVKSFLLDIFKQSSVQNPAGADAKKITAEELLDVGASRIGAQLKEQPELREELMDTLSQLNNDLGRTDRAEELAADNLAELRRRTRGRPSEATARLELRLATALVDQRHSAEAKKHAEQALSELRSIGQSRSPDTADAYFEFARAVYDGTKSEHAEGKQGLLESLAILKSQDPNDPLQGDVLDYLARYAKADERWAEAEQWLDQLLAFQTAQGVDRNAFAIGSALATLGDFQALINRYDDAEKHLRAAIAIFTKTVGVDHPSTADTRARLGEMLFYADRREEGATLMYGALQSQLRTPLGVDDATETRKALGLLEFSRGRWTVAEQLMRQNLAQLEGSADSELRYGISAGVLAAILTEEGEFAEARRHYDKSLDVYARFRGDSSHAYASALYRGAVLAMAQGKTDEAAALFTRLDMQWKSTSGQMSTESMQATLGLANIDLQLDRSQEAYDRLAPLLQHFLSSPRSGGGGEREAHIRRLLGESLLRLGRVAEAVTELRRAVELHEALDDRDSPWLAQARIDLAKCLLATDSLPEAGKLLAMARLALSHQPRLRSLYRAELDQASRLLTRSRAL